MNAGKAVYGILSANSGVTDIVGTRIFPEIAEQEAVTPFVIYQLQSVAPEDTHDGPSKLDEVRFEFLCYADSYNAAADLGVAVRAALDRVSGTYNGVHVESVQFNDVDVEIEYDPRRYSQVLKFTFRIKRDDVTIALGTPVTGAVLGDLSDVDVTGVTNGQLIAYNSTSGNWEAANDAGGANELSDLSDANVSLPSDGEVLIYSGGEFVNDNIAISNVTGLQAALDAAPDNLRELTDVTISGLADNDYLQYDSASGTWQNSSLILGRNGEQYTGNYDSEAETLLDGATETVELYYTAQADGDGLHEDAQTDTATTGYDIRRKLYYAEKAQADPNTSGDWTQFTAIADNTTFANAKAALLAYLKERTGGTVPISLKMTWEEVAQAPAFTGLLNESYGSGAAAAYGTRRLNGNYSGACMTIRRASDGTTTTIGFDGEDIDEAAIETFCNGTTCTVQVWHDQSQSGGTGSGNDAEQTDSTKQPTIYTGGALVKDGGRLALDFDGTSDFMTASGFGTGAERSVFNILKGTGDPASGYANYWIFLESASVPTTGDFLQLYSNDFDGSYAANFPVNGLDISASTGLQNQSLVTLTKSTSASNLYQDGTTVGSGSGTQTLEDELSIGKFQSNYAPQKQQEIVVYNSDKSSVRTDIEGNISGYYQSAKLLNEAYGSGAAAAYSVRQLNRDYTGAALQVERSSDNTTQDIGFDSNGDLDESALTTFCTGTICKVRTWYDQSQTGGTGSGNDAVQTDHSKQPTIYTGGAIVKENGRVAFGTNTTDLLTLSTSFAFSDFHVFYIAERGSVTNRGMFIGSGGDNTFIWDRLGSGLYLRANSVNTSNIGGSAVYGQKFIGVGRSSNVTSASINGVSTGNGASNTGTFNLSELFGGYGVTSDFDTGGNAQEVVIYSSSKSTDRTSIESNIGDYFTQNTPLLDTYTGAAAAYSLRKLRTAYSGSAIRVRRASDNTEQDIGFNVFGELDTVSLASFCSGTNGFVKTWYDQSGNANDATQTATGSQPKIYDSSTGVVTENGKPAVEFDGSNDVLKQSGGLLNSLSSYSLFSTFNPLTSATAYESYLHQALVGSPYNNTFELRRENTNNRFNPISGQSVPIQNTTSAINNLQLLISIMRNGATTNQLYQNGSFELTLTSNSYTINAGDFAIGGRSNNSIFSSMKAQEFVIYGSDKSTDRTNIESNINTFYSIY